MVKALPIGQSVIAQLLGNETISIAPDKLFNRLSFTHLAAILPCKDPLQRAFYETMAIRGTWSVRELQRQIDSNYYERRCDENKDRHTSTSASTSHQSSFHGKLMLKCC